ncbi:hypothetical protein BH11MYX3_BH11MYX3_33360 [soil metagenome]
MKIDEVRPHHCHARAQRLVAEVALIRDELGRSEDTRAPVEIQDAQPRECYFEALATWHKVDRLAAELGVPTTRFEHPAPALTATTPGHVLQVIDAALDQVESIKHRLQIAHRIAEPAAETNRMPSDVLATLIRINRELSRSLERPFTPGDVYRVVSLASTYAARLGGTAPLASFEHKRKPLHCYERLAACQLAVAAAITKRGQTALSARGVPADVLPGDVYDLASLVLGELAFLHALTANAAPVHAFEPAPTGPRLPAHVDQLARTLEAQLGGIS